MNLWERFETIAQPEEVEQAKLEFEPIPEGQYGMILEEIAPAESKNGLPMIKGKFRMVENNRLVFYNQVMQNLNYPNLNAKNIAEGVRFVSGLVGEEITFEGMSKLAQTISEIEVGKEYLIDVSYDKKDTDKKFTKLRVVTFETEEVDDFPF